MGVNNGLCIRVAFGDWLIRCNFPGITDWYGYIWLLYNYTVVSTHLPHRTHGDPATVYDGPTLCTRDWNPKQKNATQSKSEQCPHHCLKQRTMANCILRKLPALVEKHKTWEETNSHYSAVFLCLMWLQRIRLHGFDFLCWLLPKRTSDFPAWPPVVSAVPLSLNCT